MAEYKSREKRWIPEPNMLFIALCVLIYIPSTKGSSKIEFEDSSVDHWKFLIGANSREFLYDFCKYNATSTGMQCKNFPLQASIDFEKVCGCTIQHNGTINDGSLSVDLNCKSKLSYCPEELTLTYRQGSNAWAPPQVPSRRGIGKNKIESPGNPPGSDTGVDPDVATSGINGWLMVFMFSFAVNIFTIIKCLINRKLHAIYKRKWNQLSSYPRSIYSRVMEREQESDIDSLESGLPNTSQNNEVDKNAGTKFKETPLLLACKGKKEEIVRLLDFTNVDVNAQDSRKRTALHYLAAQDEPDPEKIQTLLENGANVDLQDEEGSTALHLAARFNKTAEIVKILLLYGAKVNAQDNEKWTPLHFAARLNQAPEIIQNLIENGANVDSKIQDGSTALHLAARSNENPEVLKILLKKVMKVNARDNEERTALHYAAENNQDTEVVKKLLENGADVHAQDQNGLTALHLAARRNKNPDIEQILLDATKVNVRDGPRWSALHDAITTKTKLIINLIANTLSRPELTGEAP